VRIFYEFIPPFFRTHQTATVDVDVVVAADARGMFLLDLLVQQYQSLASISISESKQAKHLMVNEQGNS
jgi:hypothetical protein